MTVSPRAEIVGSPVSLRPERPLIARGTALGQENVCVCVCVCVCVLGGGGGGGE
jgi:hypothetical protein